MEEHFYIIPISNKSLYINDTSLRDLLRENYYGLFELEMEEQYIIKRLDDEKIYSLNNMIDREYEMLKIPRKIIVVADDGIYKELITNMEIEVTDKEDILPYKEDDIEEVGDYYFSTFYKDKIFNLFKTYGFLNRKGTVKKRLRK